MVNVLVILLGMELESLAVYGPYYYLPEPAGITGIISRNSSTLYLITSNPVAILTLDLGDPSYPTPLEWFTLEERSACSESGIFLGRWLVVMESQDGIANRHMFLINIEEAREPQVIQMLSPPPGAGEFHELYFHRWDSLVLAKCDSALVAFKLESTGRLRCLWIYSHDYIPGYSKLQVCKNAIYSFYSTSDSLWIAIYDFASGYPVYVKSKSVCKRIHDYPTLRCCSKGDSVYIAYATWEEYYHWCWSCILYCILDVSFPLEPVNVKEGTESGTSWGLQAPDLYASDSFFYVFNHPYYDICIRRNFLAHDSNTAYIRGLAGVNWIPAKCVTHEYYSFFYFCDQTRDNFYSVQRLWIPWLSKEDTVQLSVKPSVSRRLPFIFNLVLPYEARVKVEAFNASGQLAQLVCDTTLESGEHVIRWWPGGLPQGIYIVAFEIGKDVRITKKVAYVGS